MPGHDVIVIGASAGGVEALAQVVKQLPSDLPAALFVVIHFPPQSTCVLPQILARMKSLPAAHARDGEKIEPGRVYIAVPDRHLLVKRGHVRVVRGPRENHSRPAIDPLFRSAALAYGPRVIGVVLSGNLSDGTAGLMVVKEKGGVTVVQDPDDAFFPDMPRNALEYVAVDYTLPLADIPPLLERLVSEPVQEAAMAMIKDEEWPGGPSVFARPECGGTLWELQDGELLRFRCRVGHAFSADNLLFAQSEALEDALWSALRALEENASLARRIASHLRERNIDLAAASFEERAQDNQKKAAVIRQILLNGETNPREEKLGESQKETD